MTEDICGAACVDGSECQHPAGSCPVPSHSDPDAENPHGRPTKFTDDLASDVIQAARDGKSKAGCARAAGVSDSTLQDWLHSDHTFDGDDFRRAFRRARARGESDLIERGLYDKGTDTSMAKFLLASSFDYTKTEKREHENTGDEPLAEVVVDFDDVDT